MRTEIRLGIEAIAVLSSLAVESVQKSAAILSCFPKLPSHLAVDGQQPDNLLGSMMPQADALPIKSQ